MEQIDLDDFDGDGGNPLDLIEHMVIERDWSCERPSEDELLVTIPGSWCAYQLRCVWRADEQVLQLVCPLDLKVPDGKRLPIHETIGLINEQLWMGHMEMWSEDGSLLFRHAVYIDGEAGGLTANHADLLIDTAVLECERFYPVFQFVLWAGKKPAEALEAAMLETVGEA
jgi:hypothetical protein